MSGASAGVSAMTDGLPHSLFLWLPSRVPDGLQRQLCSKGECFKRTSPSTYQRTTLSFADVPLVKPSPESRREGTTQVCKHQGPWLGATNISLHRRLSCCIRTPFNSVLDSRLTNMSGSTARRINVSTWDAMVNAPLAAGLGFHRGKYFLVSVAAFGCHFLRVPWSLIILTRKENEGLGKTWT